MTAEERRESTKHKEVGKFGAIQEDETGELYFCEL